MSTSSAPVVGPSFCQMNQPDESSSHSSFRSSQDDLIAARVEILLKTMHVNKTACSPSEIQEHSAKLKASNSLYNSSTNLRSKEAIPPNKLANPLARMFHEKALPNSNTLISYLFFGGTIAIS